MRKEQVFWILSIIGGCAIFSSTMSKNPVLPLFAQHLGAAEEYIGLISAASTIPGILISMPAGTLSDVYGRKRLLQCALLIFASAPLLYLFVQEVWQLALIRFYHGFATAIFGPVALAAVADMFVENRGARLGLYSSVTMIGRMVAPAAGGFLLAIGSFSSVYLACAVGGILAFILSFTITESTPPRIERDPNLKQNIRHILQNKQIMATNFVEACQYFAFGGFETFLPLYAYSVGISTPEIGLIFSIQLVITLVTKPTMGKISDTKGRNPVILLGLILCGGSLMVVPITEHVLMMSLAASGFGLGLASVTASTSALVSDLSRGSHGSALGVLSMIMDMGHASGPVVTGVLIAAWGYRNAFLCNALLLICAGALFYIIHHFLSAHER
ncbi:MAG: MFS transporter [Theionarchaea archaeon]|nr:MFS transporter [Theionarchaea archaeon]